MKLEAKTLKELSQFYGIDARTFQRWIKPHETIIGKPLNGSKIYTPKQVKLIFEAFGEPE
jgi:hypothetical protein